MLCAQCLSVALALLVFNTDPITTALWARILYGRHPECFVVMTMPVMLVGLGLALDVLGAASGLGAANQSHLIEVFAIFVAFTSN